MGRKEDVKKRNTKRGNYRRNTRYCKTKSRAYIFPSDGKMWHLMQAAEALMRQVKVK